MIRKLVAVFLVLTTTAFVGKTQDVAPGFKNWYIAGLTARVSPVTSIKFSQLYAIDTQAEDQRLEFTQTTLAGSFRMSKKLSTSFGYKQSVLRGEDENKQFHRVFTDLSLSSNLSEKWRMKNTVTAEYHWPQLRKFQYRFIYTNKISFKNKKWPLRASPYIKNQVYYYLGGRPMTYYLDVPEDGEGEEVEDRIVQSPNDFHRYRFTGGVRMRLTRGLYATVFYTWQKEFNTPFTNYRDIHVPNRSGTRIRAPFNDYSLVGLSVNYSFKLYSRAGQKAREKARRKKQINKQNHNSK